MIEAIQTADKLFHARDALRSLQGDAYDSSVEPWRAIIREICKTAKKNNNPLDAALTIAKAPGFPDGALIYVLSAAADVCDQQN